MSPPLFPETQLCADPDAQRALSLESEGVQRCIWHSRFGAMLIEVVDGVAYVNGDRVHPIGALADGTALTDSGSPE